MAGGRQQIDPVYTATGIGFAVQCVIVDGKDFAQMVVGPVVIIAIFGHLVKHAVAQFLVSVEIKVESCYQCFPTDGFLVENKRFDGGKAVG